MNKAEIKKLNDGYYKVALSMDNILGAQKLTWFTPLQLCQVAKIGMPQAMSNIVALQQFGYIEMKGAKPNLKYKIQLYPGLRKKNLDNNKVNIEARINEYKSEIKLIEDIKALIDD